MEAKGIVIHYVVLSLLCVICLKFVLSKIFLNVFEKKYSQNFSILKTVLIDQSMAVDQKPLTMV